MLSMSRKSILPMIVVLLLGTAATTWGAGREIIISLIDYSVDKSDYQPNRIVVRAGETITLTLVNNSGILDYNHELMIGREVVTIDPSVPYLGGYKKDFFDGVHVKFLGGEGVYRVTAGRAKLTGIKPTEPVGGEHHGFMIGLLPKGAATISFTVPESKVGVWDMGCFVQDGAHYERGMRGVFVVMK